METITLINKTILRDPYKIATVVGSFELSLSYPESGSKAACLRAARASGFGPMDADDDHRVRGSDVR